jgi:hypothetical protein
MSTDVLSTRQMAKIHKTDPRQIRFRAKARGIVPAIQTPKMLFWRRTQIPLLGPGKRGRPPKKKPATKETGP